MTKDSKVRPLIRMTKIKQWIMPVDAETYKTLRSMGIPLIRIHKDLWPTITLLLKKHRAKMEAVDFVEEIFNPFLDRVGKEWSKGSNREATLNSKELRFETTKTSAKEAAMKLIPPLEACLRRFFERWGYIATFDLSENRGKVRFVVSYEFDSERLPVIPLEQPPEAIPEVVWKVGFTRIVLKLRDRNGQQIEGIVQPGQAEPRKFLSKAPEVELRIEVSRGGSWHVLHTGTCLYTDIGSVAPMFKAMAQIVNIDPTNMDEEVK